MAIDFFLPEMGESGASGELIEILVNVGDTIEVDQDLFEVETDKATVTIPSTVRGKVTEIIVQLGDDMSSGKRALRVEGQAEAASAPAPVAPPAPPSVAPPAPAPVAPPAPAAPSVAEMLLPEMGESDASGELIEILFAVGDTIEVDQDLFEVETDKATMTILSSVSGTVTDILVELGAAMSAGKPVLRVKTGVDTAPVAAPAPSAPSAPAPAPVAATPATASPAPVAAVAQTAVPAGGDPTKVPAAPNVRRLARELGLDITAVPAGSSGRVTIQDLKNHSRQKNLQAMQAPVPVPAASAPAVVSRPLPDFSKWGEIETEKMKGIRRATAKQMAYAWSTAPRVTHFDKADIVDVEKLRKKYSARAVEMGGAKLTMTAILLKICAAALKQFPKFNASIDVENEQVIYKKYYNIGVAVDTPNGLVVPVIRDADQKNIFDLATELNVMAKKARDRKLKPDDMQGGTFTISNLGGVGGTNFTPIVNAPEVAILGVARGRVEPVYNGEEFVPRMLMPMGLSYDHRLVDGAEAARFMRWLCTSLEDPLLMSFQNW